MKKRFREYLDKYGNIPKDFSERFVYLLDLLKPSEKDLDKIRKAIRKLAMAKWVPLDFVFYLLPKATPRARGNFQGNRRVFYVTDAKENNDIFGEFIARCGDLYHIVTTPCKFYCDIFAPMPENMSKVEKILSELKLTRLISKPDWDNAGKTYSDMIQSHLLLDDCLIVEGCVKKYYSFKPRIEVRVEYMEKYDCKYNKKKIEGWKTYKDNIDKIEEKDSLI